MICHTRWIGLATLAAALAAPAVADDLTGKSAILCTAVQATDCHPDKPCETTAPWNLNIPQFIEIDLAGKMLSTTKASGEDRSTPIRTLLREDGNIYLQGVEGGRAFSFVISEATGMASIAVAREDVTVSVFGVCTPKPEK
ncbi:MAG TPA: hypothetical protein VFL12_09735 [Thermoanaerobaculia bacterium]|nr:hypothetical protein [Thermoanaerobaculia bacterium]